MSVAINMFKFRVAYFIIFDGVLLLYRALIVVRWRSSLLHPDDAIEQWLDVYARV